MPPASRLSRSSSSSWPSLLSTRCYGRTGIAGCRGGGRAGRRFRKGRRDRDLAASAGEAGRLGPATQRGHGPAAEEWARGEREEDVTPANVLREERQAPDRYQGERETETGLER